MKLHVLKHPNPQTLAIVKEAIDGDTLIDGFELMTPAEFESWKSQQIASGWTAAKPELTPEEIAAETARLYPDAPMWQVKVWMVRNGIDLASIPGIMAASIPAGPQLQEALARWETAPLVPFDNALVGLIASALNISKELAWSEIRAI